MVTVTIAINARRKTPFLLGTSMLAMVGYTILCVYNCRHVETTDLSRGFVDECS